MISFTHLESTSLIVLIFSDKPRETLSSVNDTFIERNLKMSGSKRSDTIDSSKFTGESRKFVEAFHALDKNDDGYVSFQELKDGLKTCGVSDEFIEKVMQYLDANKDGNITLDELLKALKCSAE